LKRRTRDDQRVLNNSSIRNLKPASTDFQPIKPFESKAGETSLVQILLAPEILDLHQKNKLRLKRSYLYVICFRIALRSNSRRIATCDF
jgi:hypothetical protein